MPWWGWVLIVLGAAGIAIGTFLVGRGRGTTTEEDDTGVPADCGGPLRRRLRRRPAAPLRMRLLGTATRAKAETMSSVVR